MENLQVNGQPAYTTVQAGAIKNFSDTLPAGMVFVKEIQNGAASLGGKMWDTTTLVLVTVVDYTDAATAEIQIAGIRDALIAILDQRVRLGETETVFDSHPLREYFSFSVNLGQPCRFYTLELQVVEEYYVPVGPGTA